MRQGGRERGKEEGGRDRDREMDQKYTFLSAPTLASLSCSE